MTAPSNKPKTLFDPLQDARALQPRIERLRLLLEIQRQQIETLNDRLYSSRSGGVAARRLLALAQTRNTRRS
jgi:hypothetical protein